MSNLVDYAAMSREELERELQKAKQDIAALEEERLAHFGQTGVHVGARILAQWRREFERDRQQLEEQARLIQHHLEVKRKEEIMDILRQVYDPDYRNLSIVEMGLVTEDDVTVVDDQAHLAYGLTAPMCPFSVAMGVMIRYALEKRLSQPVEVCLKLGHFQEDVVNQTLSDPAKCDALLERLRGYGILEQCVRV